MKDTSIKSMFGVVTKLSSEKTIRVENKVTKVHPIYLKRYTQTRHFIVHDEQGAAKVGDEVEIFSCKPISKKKSWTLSKTK